MKMKRLVVLFALTAPSTTVIAGYSGGQKETIATSTVPETAAEAIVKETDLETTTAEETTAEENTAEEDEKNYDTGGASLDNTRNQSEIGEDELLMVSFGTSYNDNRRLTVGAIEDTVEEALPDYSVRKGFTSQIIIDRVKFEGQTSTDNVRKALDHAIDNKVKNLMIQSTRLMNGLEYMDLVSEVTEHSDASEKVVAGESLFTTDDDFKAVTKATTEATAEYDDGETAIYFMGHGTEAESNQVYSRMQDMLTDAGYNSYYVGIVKASPTVEDALAAVQAGGYRKVVLKPLMIAAGDYANNDMAGSEEGSWEKTFEGAGYEVTCLVRRPGEMEAIQQLFVERVRATAESLSG